MQISTFGSRFYGGQVDRIDNGFKELNHHVNDFLGPPNLIYCNDGSHFDQAISKWVNWEKKPKLILNVLDVPHWIPEWKNIYETWVAQLNCASQVTCISEAVKQDIYNHFLLDASVIYNPVKSVHYIPETKKDIMCLFVGRCRAPNKRVREILWPLYNNLVPHFGEDCMHFVGSENSGFGVNHGVVSDEELNLLYNRSLFGMISSSYEGLNLPMIEMCLTNCKPIICRDMSTAEELGPPEFLCNGDPKSMFDKMKEISSNLPKYDDILNEYGKKYSQQFSSLQVAKNIISVYRRSL